LLAGFDHVALELVELSLAGMNDASPRAQGRERRNSQLGKLFQQELRPISLGQWGGNLEAKAEFPKGRLDGKDLQGDLLTGNSLYGGWILMAVAVEEANLVTRAKSANRSQMMRLGALELKRTHSQRMIDVKPIGHEEATRKSEQEQGRVPGFLFPFYFFLSP
jgi:hypothetical protein